MLKISKIVGLLTLGLAGLAVAADAEQAATVSSFGFTCVETEKVPDGGNPMYYYECSISQERADNLAFDAKYPDGCPSNSGLSCIGAYKIWGESVTSGSFKYEGGPYTSWSEMNTALAKIIKDDFKKDYTYGTTISLASDIELAGYSVDALGVVSCAEPFVNELLPSRGEFYFDGKKHSIKNFCRIASSTETDVSFFGSVSGDSIKNVTFDGAYVKNANAGGSAAVVASQLYENAKIVNVAVKNSHVYGWNIAGVVNSAENATLDTIKLEKVVLGNDASYSDIGDETSYIGGVVGSAKGVKFKNVSLNEVDVGSQFVKTFTNGNGVTHLINLARYIGGVVGYLNDADELTTFEKVSTKSMTLGGGDAVGGVVGYAQSAAPQLEISGVNVASSFGMHCYSRQDAHSSVGGLVGVVAAQSDLSVVLSSDTVYSSLDWDFSSCDGLADLSVVTDGRDNVTLSNVNMSRDVGGLVGIAFSGAYDISGNTITSKFTLNYPEKVIPFGETVGVADSADVWAGGVFGFARRAEISVHENKKIADTISVTSGSKYGNDLWDVNEICVGGVIGGSSDLQTFDVDKESVSSKISVAGTTNRRVYAGGVAGKMLLSSVENSSTIDEVVASGSVDVGADNSYTVFLGGVYGVAGLHGSVKVSNSQMKMNLTSSSEKELYVGGLAGEASIGEGTEPKFLNNEINAENLISLSATSISLCNVGGVVGLVTGTYHGGRVYYNSVAGDITVAATTFDSPCYVGGIVGVAEAYVKNNYSIGNISAGEASNLYVGFVAGKKSVDDASIIGNYHYGTTDVNAKKAVGYHVKAQGQDVDWEHNVTYNVTNNYRNAIAGENSLAADGNFVGGKIEKDGETTKFDGVVSDAALKSRAMVYYLNEANNVEINEADDVEGPVWETKSTVNSGLPSFAEKRTAYLFDIELPVDFVLSKSYKAEMADYGEWVYGYEEGDAEEVCSESKEVCEGEGDDEICEEECANYTSVPGDPVLSSVEFRAYTENDGKLNAELIALLNGSQYLVLIDQSTLRSVSVPSGVFEENQYFEARKKMAYDVVYHFRDLSDNDIVIEAGKSISTQYPYESGAEYFPVFMWNHVTKFDNSVETPISYLTMVGLNGVTHSPVVRAVGCDTKDNGIQTQTTTGSVEHIEFSTFNELESLLAGFDCTSGSGEMHVYYAFVDPNYGTFEFEMDVENAHSDVPVQVSARGYDLGGTLKNILTKEINCSSESNLPYVVNYLVEATPGYSLKSYTATVYLFGDDVDDSKVKSVTDNYLGSVVTLTSDIEARNEAIGPVVNNPGVAWSGTFDPDKPLVLDSLIQAAANAKEYGMKVYEQNYEYVTVEKPYAKIVLKPEVDTLVYTVSFDLGLSESDADLPFIFMSDGAPSYQAVLEKTVVDKPNDLPKILKNGYCFEGWTIEDKATSTSELYAQFSTHILTQATIEDGAFTLHAAWFADGEWVHEPEGNYVGEKCSVPYKDSLLIVAKDENHPIHGSFILKQRYGEGEEDVFEHSFDRTDSLLMFIPVPATASSMKFEVENVPDAGYKLDELAALNVSAIPGVYDEYGDPVSCDFSNNDASEVYYGQDSLKFYASKGCSYRFTATYVAQQYALSFTRPQDADNLFIMNGATGDVSSWVDNFVYSVESTTGPFPVVFNAEGCRVNWVPSTEGYEGDAFSVLSDDLMKLLTPMTDEEIAALAAAGAQQETAGSVDGEQLLEPYAETEPSEETTEEVVPTNIYKNVMTLEQDVTCERSEFYKLTLETDGFGTVNMLQILGEGDTLRHKFSLDDNGKYVLQIPKYGSNSVKFMAVGVPNEGYVLDDISFDTRVAGYDGTFIGVDSMVLDISENQDWHVSFNNGGVHYITYVLNVSEDDSTGLFTAEGNVDLNPTLDIKKLNQDLLLLYHTDSVFVGWSLIKPENRVAEDPVYDKFNLYLLQHTSTDKDEPSKLYAIWRERDADDTESFDRVMAELTSVDNATVVAYQKFGDAKIYHEFVNNQLVVAAFMYRANFYFEAVSDEGYDVDEFKITEECGDGVYCDASAQEDGSYVANDELPLMISVTSASKDDLTLAFEENVGSTDPVFYGASWAKTVNYTFDGSMELDLPTSVYRSDAALVGWTLKKAAVSDAPEAEAANEEIALQADDEVVAEGENEVVFVSVTDALRAAVADDDETIARDADGHAILQAVWDATKTVATVVVYNDAKDKGQMTLTQKDGKPYTVPAQGLIVPRTAEGLEFEVAYVGNDGYTYSDEDGVTVNYGLVDVTSSFYKNGVLTVDRELHLAPAVLTETDIQIVFDLNVVDTSSVFFGIAWQDTLSYSFEEEEFVNLPAALYRNDFVLSGWVLETVAAEDETDVDGDAEQVVYTTINQKLKDILRNEASNVARDANGYAKMKAVWTKDVVETIAVSNSAYDKGTLVLTQAGGKPHEIGAEGLLLPKVKGGLKFNVNFNAAFGNTYVADSGVVVMYGLRDVTSLYFADGVLTVDRSLDVAPKTITESEIKVAFDVNIGQTDTLFYGATWQDTLTIDFNNTVASTLPTGIYRTDASLQGWILETNAGDGETVESKIFKNLTDSLKTILRDTTSSVARDTNGYAKMKAVWKEETVDYVVVKNDSASKGTMILTQPGRGSYAVPESGLILPKVEEGLQFKVSFVADAGFINSYPEKIAVKFGSSDVTDDAYVDGVLTISHNLNLAPLAITSGDYSVTFNTVGYGAFYGDSWLDKEPRIGYSSGDVEEFPTDLYRVNACLDGWSLNETASGKIFYRFDEEFIAELAKDESIDSSNINVYPNWVECEEQTTVTVSLQSDSMGSLTVSSLLGEAYDLPLVVPNVGLKFKVTYVLNDGYVTTNNGLVYYETETGIVSLKNKILEVNGDVELIIPGEKEETVRIIYTVNADSADVFYGRGWTSIKDFKKDEDAALAMNVYRTDACLSGWTFAADLGKTYTEFNEEFREDLDALKRLKMFDGHLYGVWSSCDGSGIKIASASLDEGSMYLLPVTSGSTYLVGEDGILVPNAGLEFLLKFEPNDDYVWAEEGPRYTIFDLNGKEVEGAYIAEEDGLIVSEIPLLIKANVVPYVDTTVRAFDIVYNVNSDAKKIFYGAGWTERATYKLRGLRDSIRTYMPEYVYTSNSCVVGWSTKKETSANDTVYTYFNKSVANVLSDSSVNNLYAVWENGEKCSSYVNLKLATRNGSVQLMEYFSQSEEVVVHDFNDNGSLLLPKVANGLRFRVKSVPDSSFVMDSLVINRSGDERYALVDGDVLPFTLLEDSLVAYFSKANKNAVAFADVNLEHSGSAVRVSYETSAYEVTRGADVRLLLIDAIGVISVDTLLVDSIPETPYRGKWVKFPVEPGNYTVVIEIADATDTVSVSRTFSVDAEIASMGKDSWQMVSMAAVDTAALGWDDDQVLFWWDETGEPGEFWQYRRFARGDEIVGERGFWYSSLEGRALPLNPDAKSAVGDVVLKLDSVLSGWNLISNPYNWNLDLYSDNRSDVKDVNEKSRISFVVYNDSTGGYEETFALKPFEAAWACVRGPMEWTLKGEPVFASDIEQEYGSQNVDSAEVTPAAAGKRRALAKVRGKSNWSIQAILTDNHGRKDSWNVLGVSERPFTSSEVPAAMGDHVELSIVEGKNALAKSFKEQAENYEWELALSATSERVGQLSLVGVTDLKSLGYHVYVTVDGKTTEVFGDEPVRVALKTSGTKAKVRVTTDKLSVYASAVEGLRMIQASNTLNVGFNVDESLAGSRLVVDVLNMDGKVMATYSSIAVAGANSASLEAPHSGLYMLRVRVASQQTAGKIMVK